jgi:hypothetical protein
MTTECMWEKKLIEKFEVSEKCTKIGNTMPTHTA